MQYTVSSRGRAIGVTDLGFVRIGGPSRSGWFHPNAEGERLMPVVASVLPAMRAYLRRDLRDPDVQPLVQPPQPGSTASADLAESCHHIGALELTLHRADGSLVPTSMLGIQDMERPLALAHEDDARLGDQDWPGDAAGDDPVEDDLARDVDADLSLAGGPFEDAEETWTPDDEAPAFPRYQIHVLLLDDEAIP